MSENKPNWVDYTNLASNLIQNVQLQQLHSTLGALASLQAERARLEWNEQEVMEREDRLREHIWTMETALGELLRSSTLTPCAIYILTKQVQGAMAQCRISTASFRQFADKDRLGAFTSRLQRGMQESSNKMSTSLRSEVEKYLHYCSEADELTKAIKSQEALQQQRQRLLAKTKKRREAAVKKLEELRQAVGNPAEQSPQRSGWRNMVQGLFSKPKGQMPIREQIATLERRIAKADAEIASLSQPIPADADLTRFQARDLSELLQLKQEREAFALQFTQANNLTMEVSLGLVATTFDVILVSSPADKKVATIKAFREVKAGLGLAEAKALVEAAPKPVLKGVTKAEADAAKKRLEEAGALVEVR